MPSDALTPSAFEATEGLEDWRVLSDGAMAFYPTSSFAASAAFVQTMSTLPGIGDHPPAIDIRERGVTVRVITAEDDYRGMTQRDVAVATRVSDAARAAGLSGDPSVLENLLVVAGAPVAAEIMPFWRAVLGYVPRPDSPDEDLIDPEDRNPAFWFEDMDEPRPGGLGAIHFGVWVPFEEAEARVAAALAAGGRLIRDRAPLWWTLADPAGNEADIATIRGRD